MGKTVTAWDQNMRPYYHFTSLKACEQIIKTGKIQLSRCNIAKNVAVETKALYSALESIFSRNEQLQNKLLQLYRQTNRISLIDCLIKDRTRSYIACFSTFDENDENTQIVDAEYMWESYADTNNGVAIKFNSQAFPFYHHTGSQQDENQDWHRLTEIRIDKVIYEPDELTKQLNRCVTWGIMQHIFATDVYKPKDCELEKETRVLVHVTNQSDLDGLEGISWFPTNSSKLPDCLYYDFANQAKKHNVVDIEKVFCRTVETKEALIKILGEDKIELI